VVVLSHNGLPLAEAPDGILAGRAADGDVRSFEVLVRRHGPLLRAYASRILGSAGESDDIVQEAFITAWDQLPTVKDLDAVKSWLMRITSRKAIDRIRSRRDHAPLDEVDPAAPVSETPHQRVELSSQWERWAATARTRLRKNSRSLPRRCGGFWPAQGAHWWKRWRNGDDGTAG
jgi:RNA polymerase sigma-70 factor (ECF subfamily)